MSLMEFFAIKTPRQRREEERIYGLWAFPYGETQKEKVGDLLKALLPGEDKGMALAIYLMGREGYRNDNPLKEPAEPAGDPLAAAAGALRSVLPRNLRSQIPLYLALIQADAKIDENLGYPAAETLRETAATLQPYIKK